ncbi:MAG: Asp-tRNA(Asn)/Glu-tRNA(Gln) amidotransferase subunit GatC [Planctomycetes bacterium]|nr:Asp-tRNA(Asn)/Glu-tRNA(Gln) amidotransferase subunit GatC [Planctomycetota bacterium]
MAISREDVKYVAHLARLEISQEEEEMFCRQLGDILEYIDQLQEVEIAGVEPYISAAPTGNVFREDVVGESLSPEVATANAPEHDGAGFLVPKVVGGAGSEA